MISKTIGFRGTQHFQTHPFVEENWASTFEPSTVEWFASKHDMKKGWDLLGLKSLSNDESEEMGLNQYNNIMDVQLCAFCTRISRWRTVEKLDFTNRMVVPIRKLRDFHGLQQSPILFLCFGVEPFWKWILVVSSWFSSWLNIFPFPNLP